jgi:hypothetical protein
MANSTKQGFPAKLMQAIRNAFTPPISDESRKAPSPTEARKMKAAVKKSGASTRKARARKKAKKAA